MWTTIILIIILGVFASHYWAAIPIGVLFLGIICESIPAALLGSAFSFVVLYGVKIWRGD